MQGPAPPAGLRDQEGRRCLPAVATPLPRTAAADSNVQAQTDLGLRRATPPSALALAREPSDAPHPRPHQPNPSPEFETANTADITRDLVRADTQLHSHLATRGDYHPRQIPGTPPSLAYLPRTATPRDATSATPQHRQERFTPRRRYNAAPPTQTGQACSRRGGLGGQIHGHNPLEAMELREGARLQG